MLSLARYEDSSRPVEVGRSHQFPCCDPGQIERGHAKAAKACDLRLDGAQHFASQNRAAEEKPDL